MPEEQPITMARATMSSNDAFTARSRQNLIEVMKEEAFAFAKCRLLAEQASKRGDRRMAVLLEKTAERHYLRHFKKQAELLELFGPDQRKITEAIIEESLVVDTICKVVRARSKRGWRRRAGARAE